MTQNESLTTHSFDRAALGKRMLLGATIGLILIGLFLLGAGKANPEWSAFWRLRPLTIVPLAGATGGAFHYFITMRFQHGWRMIVAHIFGLLVFIVGLWMGSVLGLAGTYWH